MVWMTCSYDKQFLVGQILNFREILTGVENSNFITVFSYPKNLKIKTDDPNIF